MQLLISRFPIYVTKQNSYLVQILKINKQKIIKEASINHGQQDKSFEACIFHTFNDFEISHKMNLHIYNIYF